MNIKQSSLQVEIPEPYRKRILDYAKDLISDDDLVTLELNPHITIKRGIDTNRVEEVAKALGAFTDIRVMFGKTSFFPADDNNAHDVIKIDVFGESLRRLRRLVENNLEIIEQPYQDFVPHITLGWVDRGAGLMYVGNNPLIGEKMVTEWVVFSPAYGDKKRIFTDGIINYHDI